MELDQSLIALVSIITSGVVAISSVIFPIIANLIADRAKWIREKKAAEIECVNSVTISLLDKLADFRSGDVREATGGSTSKAKSDIVSAYYNWERTTWYKLNLHERDQVKRMRSEFENGSFQSLYDQGPILADQILEIANNVTDNIN